MSNTTPREFHVGDLVRTLGPTPRPDNATGIVVGVVSNCVKYPNEEAFQVLRVLTIEGIEKQLNSKLLRLIETTEEPDT